MTRIELKNANKSYGTRQVLANINLAVQEGEFVSIVGASGSGKTTLLKMAAGMIQPDSGAALSNGEALNGFPHRASIVFQNYSLLPWLSSLENVILAVESGFPEWTATRHQEQAERYLQMVGLGKAMAKRPSQLSGGMRQRVAIARAFAVEPEILFLDEPFGALDALTRQTLQQELAQLCQLRKPAATALMITNSVDEAILLSDRILTLGRNGNRGESPAATLSDGVDVPFPRPRPADLMTGSEDAVRIRARLTGFLSSGVRRRAPVSHLQSVSVPLEA